MKPARIKWEELRDIVDANRIEHFKAFQIALNGWIAETAEALRGYIEQFDEVSSEDCPGAPAMPTFDRRPEHHLEDYERLLRMIDLTDETHIELEPHEFDQYVLDKWTWKDSFVLSNSKYGAFGGE